jgi:hypothetical protein
MLALREYTHISTKAPSCCAHIAHDPAAGAMIFGIWSHVAASRTLRTVTAQMAVPTVSVVQPLQCRQIFRCGKEH